MQARRQRTPPKGRVITFYSYKGGTGRSMAVANVAWLLAMSGERVLVVDWDLEAPGIHRYFHPLLEDKELLQTEGLLDFVEKLSTRAAMSSGPLNADEVDVIEYVTMLKWPANFPVSWEKFGERAAIDLLVAGRQGPLYGKRLNAFNWVDFYVKLGGRRLLSLARQQMRSLYDYVLIDSRTGVSDTSGICTVEMPDSLVVCFTLNDQSIIGASGVAHDVMNQREAYLAPTSAPTDSPQTSSAPTVPEVPFRVFPVPTRVEIGGEQAKLQIALALARKKFFPFVEYLSRDARSKYWGSVQLSYFPFYAFEEIPAVFGDPVHQQISLLTSIRQIARALTGNESLDLVPLADEDEEAERLRKEALGWYLRKPDSGVLDPVEMAQSTYDQSDSASQQLIRRVMLRLVQVGGSAPGLVTVEMGDLGKALEPMARRLADAGILQISGNSLFIADRKIIERWDRLSQWTKEDEALLIWRQALTVSARSWLQSGKDSSALLRGKLLFEAVDWAEKRPDELNEHELDFIATSKKGKGREASLVTWLLSGSHASLAVRLVSILLVISITMVIGLKASLVWSWLSDPVERLWAPAGEHWTVQSSGTTYDLYSVFGTRDGKRLWAVGESGTIMESGDGQHWDAQTSGTTNNLMSIIGTSDGKRLWAVGMSGTILESGDGQRWNAQTSGTTNDLYSVFLTGDGKRLWAVSKMGDILESGNGEDWTKTRIVNPNELWSVFGTSDGKRLWVVGQGGVILKSDGGQLWATQASGTANSLTSVFGTSNGQRLWAVGYLGTILKSDDGQHWAARTNGVPTLYSIFGTSDGKRLWAVGESGTIMESGDGEGWTQRNSGTTTMLRSVFGTSDGKRLWAVGFGGTILESHGR
jgi:photosystem II stability/assembly factor-like uncharacterized protein/Mrp family chromosome partitioning ATPase